MSDSILLDGTGNGNRAKIDADKRLWTRSVSEPASDSQTEKGEGWTAHSEFVAVSSSSKVPFLYLQNNEDADATLYELQIVASIPGGTPTDLVVFEVYFNPTGLSGGVDLEVANRKAGEVRTFDFVCKRYDAASPMSVSTYGTEVQHYAIKAGESQEQVRPYLIIPRGKSALVTVETNGAEPVKIGAGLVGYMED